MARSQSPLAAVRRATISPPAGMVTRFCATPAPLRAPVVHDWSTALAADTVCDSSPAADAGAAPTSTASTTAGTINLPDLMKSPLNFTHSPQSVATRQGEERNATTKLASGTPGWAWPSTNWVGVVATPALIPLRKSASIRSSISGERRSASKRSRSRPIRLALLPQMGVVEVTLVLEQRVVHLPEAALEAGGLGRGREHARTRVLRGHREVAEHPRDRRAP